MYIKEEPAYKVIMNFIPTKESNKSIWEIKFYSEEEKKTILLDKFEVSEYREPDNYGLSGDIRKSVIIGDALLLDKSVYIMYCEFRKITFVKYQMNNENVKKTAYYIEDEMRGSFANFGNPIFNAKIKPITSNYLGIVWETNRLATFHCNNNTFMSISFSDDLNVINYQMPDMIEESIHLIQQNLRIALSNESIVILNYMEDDESEKFQRTFGRIYFFLQDTVTNEIKTIYYNNYKKNWVISYGQTQFYSYPLVSAKEYTEIAPVIQLIGEWENENRPEHGFVFFDNGTFAIFQSHNGYSHYNGGRYSIYGTTLMLSGNNANGKITNLYSFKIEGDILTLTDYLNKSDSTIYKKKK